MSNGSKVSRRGFLGRSMYGAASAGVLLSSHARPAEASSIDGVLEADRFFGKEKSAFAASLESADLYLDEVMDAYANGSTLRLLQSYSDQQKLLTSFVYDNALTIMAYLASDGADALRRARILRDTLLYAQSHDAMYTDGRVRDYLYRECGMGRHGSVTALLFDPGWQVSRGSAPSGPMDRQDKFRQEGSWRVYGRNQRLGYPVSVESDRTQYRCVWLLHDAGGSQWR